MKIGVIPLDERPVNTRYPRMIAAAAGAEVLQPPQAMLSAGHQPADCAAIVQWAVDMASNLDALVISCEMLGYGSLIASRTSHDSMATVLERLERLRDIRQSHSDLPIYGFNVITRVSNANDAVEEPRYWATYGEQLYTFSQLLDQQAHQMPVDKQLASVIEAVPFEHRRDMLARRLRNHTVNLGVLQLLADGVFDLLVLSSDDTSPYGLPSREKRWLQSWAKLATGSERLLMYPGADEVGCVLVARLINQNAGVQPRIETSYAPAEASTHVAAYEDGPISQTVEHQIAAVGACHATGESDIWLAVNAPIARRGEWDAVLAFAEQVDRLEPLERLMQEARERQRDTQVAVADVAYPNGADPALMPPLFAHVDLPKLAGYGAWNTAGNTVGAVLAQACVAQLITTAAERAAHGRFLFHRFVEDWAYQRVVRAEIRRWLEAEHGTAEPTQALLAATCTRIETRLNELINELPGFRGRFGLVPGSVQLPWHRTFEVDFEVASPKGGDET